MRRINGILSAAALCFCLCAAGCTQAETQRRGGKDAVYPAHTGTSFGTGTV